MSFGFLCSHPRVGTVQFNFFRRIPQSHTSPERAAARRPCLARIRLTGLFTASVAKSPIIEVRPAWERLQMDARLKQAVAVGRFGSFSKAAEAVNVTQSAVTKSVAELERRLGFPIFIRTSRGVVPTSEGRAFLERASRLIADTDELLSGALRTDPFSGSLRIGIFPTTFEWMLAKPLEVLVQRHPRLLLDITSGTKERGVQLLDQGDVDVAIGLESAFGDKARFKLEYIATISASIFVRRGHPLLELEAPVASDIARYDMVLPGQLWDLSLYPILSQIYGQAEAVRFHRIENFSLQCKVIENTDAMGFVDQAITRTDYFQSRFAVLQGLETATTAGIVCAVREQWTPKAGVGALVDILQRVHAEGMLNSDIQNRLFGHECAALAAEAVPHRG
ncbi:LysR family transcriptional regulator [Cupriavidus pinatubonensis]|nr:LysR family transcriptional regulator [Cupriavidus pinatubonensis]